MGVVLWQITNVLPHMLWGEKMGVSLPFCHMTLYDVKSLREQLVLREEPTNLRANPAGKTCVERLGQTPKSMKKNTLFELQCKTVGL